MTDQTRSLIQKLKSLKAEKASNGLWPRWNSAMEIIRETRNGADDHTGRTYNLACDNAAGMIANYAAKQPYLSSPERESSEDKLHELILRLARACDCATIVSCGNNDDKMLMLRIVEQVRGNIKRHTQINGFVEIWLAKEFPERYQLEQMPTNEIEDGGKNEG